MLVLLSIPALFLVSVAGIACGAERLVFAPIISEMPFGPFFFGLIIGAVQVAFGRLMGLGAWAGD